MQVIKNILGTESIQELLAYNHIEDNRTDARPDVTSKHPRWDIDEWPQHIVEYILNKVLDYDYEVEEVIFNTSKISFRIHADSGHSDQDRKGHAVLIPLEVNGPSHTVFFDNYWNFDSTKFSKVDISPFQYKLPNKHGKWIVIQDIRELLQAAENKPETITEFEITTDFIEEIRNLVKVRSNQGISKVDDRCYDYSNVINYNENYSIDNETYETYLNHVDFDSVKGLSIDGIAEWQPGSCIKFPRTQLHCAGSGHTKKTGITVFTRPKTD